MTNISNAENLKSAHFVGRREYLDDLESLWRKATSSLIACRGRRRIGKSTLIREFARRTSSAYIEIEGMPPDKEMTNQRQLDHFVKSLAEQTGASSEPVSSWIEAFHRLEGQIDEGKRTVVLLDEVSWMGGYDVNYPGALRTAWETYFHRHPRLIVAVCGSVSAWIRENILNNTGFTGRFSRDYVLPELNLAECAEFWRGAKDRISVREIFDVLSVTGGIPRYLEEIDPGLSAEENIRRMCFSTSGELYKDFDAIFSPIFGVEVEFKRRILEALADGPMSGAELSVHLGLKRSGRMASALRELKDGGFLSDDPGLNPATGESVRTGKYRLKDNYTRFYIKYVKPRKPQIEAGSFRFTSLGTLPEWNAVMGLQFENLIVNNAMSLIPYLHLGNSIVESAAPYRNMRRDAKGAKRGCQIDLLIQTPMTAYAVEIKRKREIDESIIAEMKSRIDRLPLRKGMTPRPVLVYDGDLAPYVEGSGYFDAVIPAAKLIGR
jgi:AAA+ ATPase superfamily predicted ATPase